ncbi:MAG: hypothetical protein JWO17_446 [Actinomycetia bacterium]|jgi:hypothetical protein|nr:hypothetical protein [Actinomycetes bacterium]
MTSLPPSADQPSADERPELNGDRPGPGPDLRRFLEEAESSFAQALEKMVAGPMFGLLLAQTTENMVALSKIARESADLAVSNLRIAGRRDVIRLERQLGRTEDKLETLLQEIEGVRSELANGHRVADRAPSLAPASDD